MVLRPGTHRLHIKADIPDLAVCILDSSATTELHDEGFGAITFRVSEDIILKNHHGLAIQPSGELRHSIWFNFDGFTGVNIYDFMNV